MPLRYNVSSDKVKANCDRIAVTRGPLVYCAEQADNGEGKVQRFFIPRPADLDDTSVEFIRDGVLKGVPRLSVPGMEIVENSTGKTTIKLIPYYAWNNRGDESMIVWMARNKKVAGQ